jgi:hypothetical protein
VLTPTSATLFVHDLGREDTQLGLSQGIHRLRVIGLRPYATVALIHAGKTRETLASDAGAAEFQRPVRGRALLAARAPPPSHEWLRADGR